VAGIAGAYQSGNKSAYPNAQTGEEVNGKEEENS
jgi:hypothetical protein